jgi:PAS domain S-box-containing protein
MSKLAGNSEVDYILDQKIPFSKERYKQIIEESKELIIPPLRIMALMIAVSGIFAMIFEARHFAGFSVPIYLTRLTATIISFVILVLLNSRYGSKYAVHLVHVLMLVIIISSGYMIYLLPSTLVMNSHILGLIIFTSALFLSWEVKHQIIMVVYYNIVFGASILLNSDKSAIHPDLLESVIFVLFLSIISVVGSSVSFRLRLALAEKTFRVQLSEKKFKAIFDNSAEGIFQTTPEGQFLTANQALIKILGFNSREELMNTNIVTDIYFNPSDRTKLLQKIKSEGEIKNYIIKLKKKNGSPVIVKINERIVTDDERNRAFYEGSMQDITEQVIAEEKRQRFEELLRIEKERSDKLAMEAQESNLIKSQFLANMSHEIRTPMNGIIGYLSLIEKEAYEDTDEMRQFAASAKSSADALLDIVNNILDLSKIESGKMVLNIAKFNIGEVIDEAVSIVSSKAAEKKLTIYRSIDKNTPFIVHGDGVRLRQILINLLSNAIKFTDSGEIRVEVKLLRESEDKLLLGFSVKDSGVGISKDKIETLFQPFSQIDSSPTRRYGGTGLGLAICKEFVSMMGGEISARSEEGKGSSFDFHIPFKYSKIDISAGEENYSKSYIFKETGSNFNSFNNGEIRILLAEDNLINQKIAVRMLNNSKFLVDTAISGSEAINKLNSEKYDLLLLDIQMPDMDGFMVTEKIRNSDYSFKNIPIIAITAHAMSGYKEKCLAAGMDDYLTKPIIADELIIKINHILKIEKDPADTEEASVKSSVLFDFQQLHKMSLGERGFEEELVNTFLDDTKKRVEEMETHLRNKDLEMIKKEAHTIKGAGSSIGAVEIASHALAVEISVNVNDIENAIRNFINLNTAVGETRKILKDSGIIK